MTRTSVHLAVVVDDATFHAVSPTPREQTRWRLFRVKVLGVGVRIGSVRSKHLLELIDFGDVSADHWWGVGQSVPVTPALLTTWMYRTPEIIE